MNLRQGIFYTLLASFIPFFAHAQIGCEYHLELYDTYGDGWNGGFLTVTINDKSENFPFEDGASISFQIFVEEGDSLDLSFTPGLLFSEEASFRLFDGDENEVFFSGENPKEGFSFGTRIDCPDCPNLLPNGISVEAIRHDQARIRWDINDPEGQYLLQVIPSGALPGEENVIQTGKTDNYNVDNLEEHTKYDAYLQALCSNGDTSNQIGPFTFETLWAKDVGVSTLVSPISDCDLPAEATITVALKNYGGNPQTLIPFNYSVNGIPGAVNQPNDGLFTGILSFDSTFVISFDATYNFSEPIEYIVKVWTELEGDGNASNDTLTSLVITTPLIYEFPYVNDFEDGSGGWLVDEAESRFSTLELGTPSATIINTANSGEQAWVTNVDGFHNNREHSILLSPCLNFSKLEKDPEFTFSLFVASESTYDGAWVETSIAGGEWTKLGASGEGGSSWYNAVSDIYGDWWSGENLFGGWQKVRYPLTGFAGEEDVRIRIVFQADQAVTREGIAIDDIFIGTPLGTNMTAVNLSVGSSSDCGSVETEVTLNFRNEGSDTLKNIQLAYQVNGGPVVTEELLTDLLPEVEVTYTFMAPFSSIQPDDYVITAWTKAAGEEFPVNDSLKITYSTTGPGIPYLENFEGGMIPSNWRGFDDVSVENGHNSGSNVLYDNLWENDTLFQADSPLLGPIAMGDSLFFSYRFVNFMGSGVTPTILSDKDVFVVEVSEDCGSSFNEIIRIDASNHQTRNTPTFVNFPLGDYAGQWIKLRFKVTWGAGDYYFDLDDVNVKRCPGSLIIQASVSPAVNDGKNGSIRLEPGGGVGPYRYLWSNGGRNVSQNGLAPGAYQITVTDQQGCMDFVEVVLESVVDSKELPSSINSLRLYPNPSSGQSVLDVDLKEPNDVLLSIYDARGRLVQQSKHMHVNQRRLPLDLSTFANGLYFIQLLIDNEVSTIRILKTNTP